MGALATAALLTAAAPRADAGTGTSPPPRVVPDLAATTVVVSPDQDVPTGPGGSTVTVTVAKQGGGVVVNGIVGIAGCHRLSGSGAISLSRIHPHPTLRTGTHGIARFRITDPIAQTVQCTPTVSTPLGNGTFTRHSLRAFDITFTGAGPPPRVVPDLAATTVVVSPDQDVPTGPGGSTVTVTVAKQGGGVVVNGIVGIAGCHRLSGSGAISLSRIHPHPTLRTGTHGIARFRITDSLAQMVQCTVTVSTPRGDGTFTRYPLRGFDITFTGAG